MRAKINKPTPPLLQNNTILSTKKSNTTIKSPTIQKCCILQVILRLNFITNNVNILWISLPFTEIVLKNVVLSNLSHVVLINVNYSIKRFAIRSIIVINTMNDIFSHPVCDSLIPLYYWTRMFETIKRLELRTH
jgi:hypothetical protein